MILPQNNSNPQEIKPVNPRELQNKIDALETAAAASDAELVRLRKQCARLSTELVTVNARLEKIETALMVSEHTTEFLRSRVMAGAA